MGEIVILVLSETIGGMRLCNKVNPIHAVAGKFYYNANKDIILESFLD